MIKDRKMNRLRNYDYSQSGCYYITICVHPELRKQNIFGEIDDGIMKLNDYGVIISKQWLWIAERYNHIIVDEWVIMPDHFHAIIKIVHIESENNTLGTGRDLSAQCNSPVPNHIPSPQKYKPLPQIMGAFKTTSSKMIHLTGYSDYAWQRSYYDNIIRNDESLNRIRKYIINNPINWNNDI
jgi:putative transposase